MKDHELRSRVDALNKKFNRMLDPEYITGVDVGTQFNVHKRFRAVVDRVVGKTRRNSTLRWSGFACLTTPSPIAEEIDEIHDKVDALAKALGLEFRTLPAVDGVVVATKIKKGKKEKK